jgi:hypothetical protein
VLIQRTAKAAPKQSRPTIQPAQRLRKARLPAHQAS